MQLWELRQLIEKLDDSIEIQVAGSSIVSTSVCWPRDRHTLMLDPVDPAVANRVAEAEITKRIKARLEDEASRNRNRVLPGEEE